MTVENKREDINGLNENIGAVKQGQKFESSAKSSMDRGWSVYRINCEMLLNIFIVKNGLEKKTETNVNTNRSKRFNNWIFNRRLDSQFGSLQIKCF